MSFTLEPIHITKNGWLKSADWLLSPNFNERPDGLQPELIVIHGISLPPAQFGTDYIQQFFTNVLPISDDLYFEQIKDLKVSSHLLIQRSGHVIQFVPFIKRAWHAGISCYQNRQACNDFSIGIELEGTDDTIYTDAQYHQLCQILKALWHQYPSLKKQAVTGHSDIAPGRKTDPGEYFDWDRLQKMTAQTFKR